MNAKTIAIHLAKDVFEVALANEQGRIVGRERLSGGGVRLSFSTVAQRQ